ncbi:hypothetical protein MARVELLAND_240 [Bacillus phage vB_BspM_MarvelLand]|nr:hypothetical protein MARVELLAND_240 [Bacillus phage vB_BspM_MarvelLand]
MNTPEKVELLYHNELCMYFTNDPNWKERWKTENIEYGVCLAKSTCPFELKRKMHEHGYVKVKKSDLEGTPFSSRY